MCRLCEGFSHDDVDMLDAATIAEYGYLVRGVGSPDDPTPQWCYTIGLLDAAGHPELVVAGIDMVAGARCLNTIGRSLLAGERFEVGDMAVVDGDVVRLGAVDPVQYRLDTFASWHGLHAAGIVRADQLEVLQVVVPESWFCACHAHAQPVLSDPAARVDLELPGPSRAGRRRMARDHRRGRRR